MFGVGGANSGGVNIQGGEFCCHAGEHNCMLAVATLSKNALVGDRFSEMTAVKEVITPAVSTSADPAP